MLRLALTCARGLRAAFKISHRTNMPTTARGNRRQRTFHDPFCVAVRDGLVFMAANMLALRSAASRATYVLPAGHALRVVLRDQRSTGVVDLRGGLLNAHGWHTRITRKGRHALRNVACGDQDGC